ncbi:hypothetical protein QZH41_015453, partial [Actinostola sp. cb2023]
MPIGTRSAGKKGKDKEDTEVKKESRDAETQTDPEITGVDADDFEEDDGSEGEEDSETETSGDEENEHDKRAKKIEEESNTTKGTHARPVPRKKIELKYYFGEDMPDSELKKLAEADVLVPPGLQIRPSNTPRGGLGVFARCIIPKHEFFGPYVGKHIPLAEADKYKDIQYVWEVLDDYGKIKYLVDGRDSLQSNWLKYVSCSSSVEEQNIRSVQYDNNIYYMVTKEVKIGHELLTYYGERIAKKLGIKVTKSTAKPKDGAEPNFACKNCGKMYTNPSALIGHLKFKCSSGQQRSIFIPMPATGPRSLIPKIKVSEEYAKQQNEKMKKFKCEECGKAFIRNYTLQCHMLIHKGVKDFKCEVCDKEFTLMKHLQRHKLVHTGEKPYKCHLCGRSFSQQGSLQAHSRTHTGIKPYKCKICGRAFALQSPLLSHIKTHSNEKAFKCEKCGKEFTHRNTLSRHELIHSGKRPFKCEKCGKTFTQTNDLKRHSRIHTGIRPYMCHVCGKSFTVEFTLVCHVRTHTGDRPYVCDYCDKSFTQPGARLKHSRKCHPDLPPPTSQPLLKGNSNTKTAIGTIAAASSSTSTSNGANKEVATDASTTQVEMPTVKVLTAAPIVLTEAPQDMEVENTDDKTA